jgi:hypothetical protein
MKLNFSRWNGVVKRTLARKVFIHLTVKVKVKFTREQAMKAQREDRGIALLFP